MDMTLLFLVTKDSNRPSILRLVLQCLSKHWETISEDNEVPAEDQATVPNRVFKEQKSL